ncbi:MmcQ/YjbR family DNA-binding protein [Rodentibacter myodis]|uniref:MmcQ protein n=1 Tax=Rodentibacter myodis TaxID=1907939 RepID=A0A1V3JH28_9PAST|nr:MmcQ/YjbR family DNA-binding protein [Rodentibacter myodis]OOF55602.1 MmcQ protein [Rodentibacter myodis]
MDVITLRTEIEQRYSTQAEYLWAKFPDYAVFRHQNNRKWFAILMPLESTKLGIKEEGKITIITLKAKLEEIGSLRMMEGVYPAYHMNKEHWLSLNLSEIDHNLLFELLDESFTLTAQKLRKK